jgi:two-component system, OmpR family, sensor kinase
MIPPLTSRFGLRGRIWITVASGLAAVLVLLTAGFNVVISNRLRHDANNVAIARATAELDGLKVSGARIDLTETFDAGAVDTPTWVFQGARALEAPRVGAVTQAAAAAMTRRPRGFRDVAATDERLYAVPILSGTRRVGTVVSAASLAPYEQIQRIALVGSSLVALLTLVAVAAASRWIIARSLRPVSEMTRQAAEWSEHRLDRRFSMGEPRDEFTTLAATLDSLLDRVAASLRHEQNLTAELSHELRTPLTQISAEAQYALRHIEISDEQQQSFSRILDSVRRMTRILDTLIAAARAQAGGPEASCEAGAAARAAIEPFRELAADSGAEIDFKGPVPDVRLGYDAAVIERILAPLLENACRFSRHRVGVEVIAAEREVLFVVADDGVGIQPEDAESVFQPGFRSDGAAVALLANAGLGLPLARRLARGLGGDVRVGESETGARIVVTLPRG